MSSAVAAAASSTTVRTSYRTLARLIQRQPDPNQGWKELRTSFRRDMKEDETVGDRLKQAGERIAYLRIVTPKGRRSTESSSGQWRYKDGKPIKGQQEKSQDGYQVHSNWSGSNMDPCSVKRHTSSLKRAGFVNNLHAKGIF